MWIAAVEQSESMTPSPSYDVNCRRCPRLATFLDQVKVEYPTYVCQPVPPFGDPQARLLVVGLAPGLHGANATGRPFTGDWCGPLLYSSLHRYGFASAPHSERRDDDLRLIDCRVTNAVKCLPPQNKPELQEIRTCNAYLAAELADSPQIRVIVALGTIAHASVIAAYGLKLKQFPFAHHAQHHLPHEVQLIDSYHVSRYNTNTKRLTEAMFHAVLADARALIDA